MNLNICTPSINSDFNYSSVPAVITRPLSGFRVGPSLLGLEIRKGKRNTSQMEQDAAFASPLCSACARYTECGSCRLILSFRYRPMLLYPAIRGNQTQKLLTFWFLCKKPQISILTSTHYNTKPSRKKKKQVTVKLPSLPFVC